MLFSVFCQAFFNDRQLVSAESGHIDGLCTDNVVTDEHGGVAEGPSSGDAVSPRLSAAEAASFAAWLENSLEGKVTEVKVSDRLINSAAMITNHQSPALQRMMRFVNQQANAGTTPGGQRAASEITPKMAMEVNPAHPIICRLNSVRLAR